MSDATKRTLRVVAPLAAAALFTALLLALSPRVGMPPALEDPLAIALSVGPALAALVVSSRARAAGAVAAAIGLGGAATLAALYALGLPSALVPLQVLALLCVARGFGGSIGAAVAHPGHMLPATIIAAAADLASVLSPEGPTHQIAASERALSVAALAAPVPGTAAITFTLGVGDLTVIALYLGVALRFEISRTRVVGAAVLGLIAAFALAFALAAPVPALIPIGAASVALVPEFRRVARADRTAAIVGAAIALGVVVAVLLRR